MKLVLHAGCADVPIPEDEFPPSEWSETRFDLDPKVRTDYVGNMCEMEFASEQYDALLCRHTLEHVHAHEVLKALKEFHRVLKPGGTVHLMTPDLMAICSLLLSRGAEGIIYITESGPITPIDMLYGHRSLIASGYSGMVHKTGFTQNTLKNYLLHVGFKDVVVERWKDINLKARAKK